MKQRCRLAYLSFACAAAWLLPGHGTAQAKAPFEVKEHVVMDRLHGHLGNLVYRRGVEGGRFVGWGRLPIQEWVFGTSRQRQVVPTLPDGRYSNGGAALDVDGDGIEEIVVARGTGEGLRDSKLYWFREVPGREHWEEHFVAEAAAGAHAAPHDIQPLVVTLASGEVVRGVVANVARREVFFLEVPDDPTRPWIRHHIGTFPVPSQSGMEIVDVDGDDRKDIVTGMYWIRSPADPRQPDWTFHRYGTWNDDKGRWGGMIKHAVADFDGDGQVEIVAAEAEIPGARLALFQRQRADGTGLWRETLLEDDLYAPHSVVTGDLDADGRPDFIVGEMSAAGWDFTINPNPRIYGYVSRGGRFERHLIAEGWGVHEMRVLPERIDGHLVVYAADEIQPQKFDGMMTHIGYWTIGPRE